MTCRVQLVAPATSPSLREARFYDGDSIDDLGKERARAAAGALTAARRVVVSPSRRCEETAAALGLDGERAPELAGLDVGRWRGRTLEEVGAGEPETVARWLGDPDAAPHGGESVQGLCARVAHWLEGLTGTDGHMTAVVEPEIVRAAVVHTTGTPVGAFWRLDVPPLTVTELSGRSGRWNLRLGRPLVAL
jgi:broad specificity phosphatase PhoE